ncbi:hypothetical protein DICSQDRAFT_138833 [Dichomitus squalens LYAD-421 SS1]|uniref:Uncharacterized protein n=1 Tax=Dichomitus squalens (strain LYAD-421) TaxID=732165 RepID=R7STN8_DICSQ|nr:uncharacterized protein DICSQDRAFT_138833 [Dichomitus squalens LYAD-421 SS1]EJF59105.1 hypothetical protein DICSQDRAFT_138833 [Dichomitus squalens LYAD-421 SS1]
MDEFCTITLAASESFQAHPSPNTPSSSLRLCGDLSSHDRAALLAHITTSNPVNEDSNAQYQAYCVIG